MHEASRATLHMLSICEGDLQGLWAAGPRPLMFNYIHYDISYCFVFIFFYIVLYYTILYTLSHIVSCYILIYSSTTL